MARPIWSGTIAFGLVSIPVKMFAAVTESKLDFDMLDKNDQSRIRYKRINESSGKEVSWKNIVKGYKINKRYVVLEDKDFERAAAERSKRIDIESFVREKDIDPIYYDASYYLVPSGEEKPYSLLRSALKKTGMVAMGTYVLRNREHLGVIKVYEDALVLVKLHFEEEIRSPQSFDIPKGNTRVKSEELKMAVSLVQQMEKPFDISKYRDAYTAELLKFIRKKAKGKLPPEKKEKKTASDDVQTLMDQLKASLTTSSVVERRKRKKTEVKA